MMPQAFVLAAPLGWRGQGGIATCTDPGRMLGQGPCLWRAPETLSVAASRDTIVVGALFRGGRTCLARDLHSGLHAACSPAARACWLARECWGAYFAVGIDPEGTGVWAFSDPSGLLPVYRMIVDRHVLLTSDPRLLAGVGVAAPAVAWPALADHLRFPELRQVRTCLTGIDELAPGQLHRLNGDTGSSIPVWRPAMFMPDGTFRHMAETAEALRSCAVQTLGAWADFAGPVAVAASGGVDSSLICAALGVAGRQFGCITLATADPSGDERPFVTTLGDHLGAKVSAAIYDPAAAAPTCPASSALPRPTRRTFMRALDTALDRARGELGADVVFDGNSGDNLFCFLHSAAPVVDRLVDEGFGPAWSTLLDMCRVTDCDAATMIRAAWRRWKRGDLRRSWPADTRLLAPGAPTDRDLAPLTPWIETIVGALSGKIDHLALLQRGQNLVHGLGESGGARFSPLASQPLVELCLAVPTWLWCAGGINRSPARQAFAAELPPAILRRRSKAGPDSFIRRIFTDNRAIIRQLLLDGLLGLQGVIDRAAVEAALHTDALSGDAIVNRLLDLTEAELWTRSWSR